MLCKNIKIKPITHKSIQGLNVIQPTMPKSIDERDYSTIL